MQPLAYLAVRALLGWLQVAERTDRAFVSTPLVLVAAGAVHCWAVVYSLFVAVHTRAMRVDGYHEGYIEHLPSSVSITETLAVASLWVWLLAGFTTAAVRILDEDSGNLPMGLDDAKGNPLIKLIRSPMFHSTLGHAHSVSCVGLFVSILMLCFTMAFMKGGITVCELCLAVVSIGFAVPHAVLAARRLSEGAETVLEALMPARCVEGAAAEAAALGPQLCIVLALADAPGHAYLWQNIVYGLSSVALLVAVAACYRSPPKASAMALPPELHESVVCLGLDAAAAISIVLSYPHLNTWLLWLCCAALVALAACVRLREVREVYLEWLEPVFVVRSDTHKRLPDPQRQLLRRNAWILGLFCAATALWDITWHPVPQPSYALKNTPAFPDLLMLRWQSRWSPAFSGGQANERILSAAAKELAVDATALEVETTIPEHRLVVFKYNGQNSTKASVTTQWRAAMLAPSGQLAEIADHSFPAVFSAVGCLWSHAAKNQATSAEATSAESPSAATASAETTSTASSTSDADAGATEAAKSKEEDDAAYMAVCNYWKDHIVNAQSQLAAAAAA